MWKWLFNGKNFRNAQLEFFLLFNRTNDVNCYKKELYLKRITCFLICLCLVYSLFSTDFPVKISKLDFNGNNSLSYRLLSSNLPVKVPGLLSRIKSALPLMAKEEQTLYFEEDLQNSVKTITNLYQKNGFLKVSVRYQLIEKKKAIQAIFIIKESLRVRIENIDIKTSHDAKIKQTLEEKTKQWENSDFTDDKFIKIKKQIEHTLLENAYFRQKTVYTFQLSTDSSKVIIHFDIDEGKKHLIEDIQIKGNEQLKQKTIMKQLPLPDSTFYHPSLTEYYSQQLSLLNHFSSINVETEGIPDSKDKAGIRIVLTEKSKHQFKSGIGYGMEDRFRAFAEYNQYNFMGNARHLQLNMKRSALEPWNISLKTREPLPFRHSFYGTFNPFWLRQEESIYELERTGLILGISQNINISNSYQVNYLFEQNHLYNAEVYDTDSLQSVYNKSSLYLNWQSNYQLNNQGFNNSINLNRSGLDLGSRYHFFRGLNDSRYYYPLTTVSSLAFRLKYGYLTSFDKDKVIPVEERFYAGGSNSIRGWSRNQISPLNSNQEKTGGNRLFELSAESRTFIIKDLEFAFFFDTGNVWIDKVDLTDLLSSVGTGLRYYSLLGPIRFDVARPTDRSNWQFYLQIGQSF